MIRTMKCFAMAKAAYLYECNKRRLWAGMRESSAMSDAAQCLRKLLPKRIEVTEFLVKQCLDEISSADLIKQSVEKYREVIGKGWNQKLSGKPLSAILFCFVALRLVKPEVVVETGCATGWTSTLLLFALAQNNKGHLYSIDLPARAGRHSMEWTLPGELSPGFLIPETLRQRWTLILGDTRDHLIPLLQKKGNIDAFFHDSDHTYNHMMWEYTSVWPHLNPGGLLLSDDIGWNTAFWDFGLAVERPIVFHRNNPNFGALSKLT